MKKKVLIVASLLILFFILYSINKNEFIYYHSKDGKHVLTRIIKVNFIFGADGGHIFTPGFYDNKWGLPSNYFIIEQQGRGGFDFHGIIEFVACWDDNKFYVYCTEFKEIHNPDNKIIGNAYVQSNEKYVIEWYDKYDSLRNDSSPNCLYIKY